MSVRKIASNKYTSRLQIAFEVRFKGRSELDLPRWICYNNTVKIKCGYMLMEFKDKVKFARQKPMLSQTDLAKKWGVAISTINE